MRTVVKWLMAIALGVALQSGAPLGGSSAGATDAEAKFRPNANFRAVNPPRLCRFGLPAHICAADGIVAFAPGVDRRILSLGRTGLLSVDLRPFAPWLLKALDPERTVTLVISSRELRSGRYNRLIEAFVDRGGVLVVTNPVLEDVERLEQLTGLGATTWEGDHKALLYGVRNAIDGERVHEMSFVLLRGSDDGTRGSAQSKKRRQGGRDAWLRSVLNEDETAWLVERIGQNPPVTQRATSIPGSQSSCEGVDPQSCINELALSTHTSVKLSQDTDSLEVDNFIYSARSFGNEEDLYYVAQDLQSIVGCDIAGNFALTQIESEGASVPISSVILPSPDTTEETTTVTSGVSFGLGGSAGYQSGAGKFDVSASAAFSHSTTTEVPSVQILNATDINTATPIWAFFVSVGKVVVGSDSNYSTAWIWTVSRDAYNSDAQKFDFVTTSGLANSCNPDGFFVNLTSNVDQPFPTKTIEEPVVISISGSPVSVGQQFQINGTGFYPSLVESVLLGGNAVPSANISTTSDSVIAVTAPNDSSQFPFNTPLAVAVRTSAGTSNADQKVTIRRP